MNIIIRGATLLMGDDDWRARDASDILIADGRIAAIGRNVPAPEEAAVIDGVQLLVMPAFVNAHTHSPEMLGRARVPMARQMDWLAYAYGEGRDSLADPIVARTVALCAAENVRGGSIAVTDHFRQVPARAQAIEAAARAWDASGLRAKVAINLRDRLRPDGSLVGVAASDGEQPATRELLAMVEQLMDQCRPGSIVPGPSAPQRVTDDLLRETVALARSHNVLAHMHVCECREDAEVCLSLYGESAIAHLDRIGVLGPDLELVHAVHIDERDIALIADSGARLIHSPVANLRLGSGVAPIAKALRAGIDVRLATDGAGSNDTQSMLEAVKFALLAPRAAWPESEWLTPVQVLRMATGCHRLSIGNSADFIAFNLGAAAFVNADDPASNVVLAARESDLVHVVAGGRFLMMDGQLCLN